MKDSSLINSQQIYSVHARLKLFPDIKKKTTTKKKHNKIRKYFNDFISVMEAMFNVASLPNYYIYILILKMYEYIEKWCLYLAQYEIWHTSVVGTLFNNGFQN